MISQLKIRTPEGVDFAFQLAGPVSRCMAYVVDFLCVGIIVKCATIALVFFAIVNLDISVALMYLVQFIATIGYGIVLEWFWRGQTIGKRLMKLRVIDEQGLRLEFQQVMIRNLLRFIDAMPGFYVIGGLACFFSRHCQRFGDLAASTVVVRIKPVTEPDLDQITQGKFNSLRAHVNLAARLRQRVSPAEAAVAFDALLRRDSFEPAARVKLFYEIAERFRILVPFPPETSESMTDEQYLRNAVDILFRVRK